jgi:o-succinylbenzoate synthase
VTAARSRGGNALAGASAVRVRIPFRSPFVTAAGTWHERDAWIVTLRDAEGREGVGEASLEPGASTADVDALAAAVRAAIADPARWSGAPGDADVAGAGSGNGAVALALQAAFAGAAADLERHRAPGPTGFVPVNATIATESLDETLEAVEAALDAGFDCLKLKGGREHTSEGLVERLALVRALAGDDIELRLDVNGAWDRQIAAERLGAIAHLDIAYVEQPIPPGDLETLAWLRRVSPIEIAADESVGSRADAEAVLAAGAADVLVVKPARVGGPHEAEAIAAAAAGRGVAVTISTLLETGVGLAAAIRVAAALRGPDRRRAHGLATANVLVDDLLATPLEVHDGRIRIPAEPLELDEAAVARWAVGRVEGSR